MSGAQDAVVDFLASPETHRSGASPVRRIDTHGAIVFLAGDRAYKIKRAVKLPYLDFSSLEKREAALRAEIEANRPFAPELYLDLIAVKRGTNGRLSLGGEGEPVEWALVMRRFDENATLDRVAARGELTDTLARSIGEVVASKHAQAPPVPAGAWIEALGRFVDDETSAIVAADDVFEQSGAIVFCEALRSELARIAPLLFARGDAGFIRRGHGDLHLRNIALIDGKPVLFDALEFDPIVASGDVLYDLAFLLMDLLGCSMTQQANIVFNRYLVAANRDEHLDVLGALPFFLALRAAIRTRTALDKRMVVTGAEHEEEVVEARTYLSLASRLIVPKPPCLAAIGGLSGTGKSTMAAALAPFLVPEPGAVHLRSDVERKRMAGVGELERLPRSAYAAEASGPVYRRLESLAARVLAARHSAVTDAVYARPEERQAIAQMAKSAGVPFTGVWLELPLEERARRVTVRRGDASDADVEVVRSQETYSLGDIGWLRIDASGPPGDVLKRIRAAIGL